MLPFLCYRCFLVSNSVEGLRCPRCDGDEYGTVMAANFDSAIPEYGNAGPEYYVTVVDASTQVSEEDLVPVEPTREASTQVSEEDLVPEEPTREASTQTSDHDLPLKIAGSHGYENCLKSDCPSQNQATHDFEPYTNSNQNGLTHSNTNEGEFQNQSYGIRNAANLLEVMDDKPAASKQSYVYEQSSVGENESSSDELLRRQGPKERIERGIKSASFALTDSITLESKYPAQHLLSDSTEKVEDRQGKDHIPPPFSFCPQRNTSIIKCFQENLVTANRVAQRKPQTSGKLSKRWCGKCERYFMTEWTFDAHLQNYCSNPRKPNKCAECGAIFPALTKLLLHQRMHTGEKPFKCTQCDYATKWPSDLKRHLKAHTNIPHSISSFSRRNPSVNKSFQEHLVTLKKVKQKNPQSSNKKKMTCRKCGRYFRKESTLIAHVQSNCNPRPFKCGHCDERFSSMSRLINHEQLHSGEKPFKCTQCDHATKWPHLHKKHLETHR